MRNAGDSPSGWKLLCRPRGWDGRSARPLSAFRRCARRERLQRSLLSDAFHAPAGQRPARGLCGGRRRDRRRRVLHQGRRARYGVRGQSGGLRLSGASVGGGDRLHAQFPRAGADRRCGRADCVPRCGDRADRAAGRLAGASPYPPCARPARLAAQHLQHACLLGAGA